MEFNRKRRGRPLRSDARRNRLDVRLSSKELSRAHNIADTYDVSLSEALRIALNQYYERLF